MNGKSWAQLGLVAVLLAAACAMFFRSSDQPRIDFNPYQALGAIAAEEVSKTLGGQGRIVLVIPAPGPDPDPVMDSQLDAFKSALKSHGKVEVASTVLLRRRRLDSSPRGVISTGAVSPWLAVAGF